MKPLTLAAAVFAVAAVSPAGAQAGWFCCNGSEYEIEIESRGNGPTLGDLQALIGSTTSVGERAAREFSYSDEYVLVRSSQLDRASRLERASEVEDEVGGNNDVSTDCHEEIVKLRKEFKQELAELREDLGVGPSDDSEVTNAEVLRVLRGMNDRLRKIEDEQSRIWDRIGGGGVSGGSEDDPVDAAR